METKGEDFTKAKEALDYAEKMGFDRGVMTIFTQLLKTMDESKMLSISYSLVKELYLQYQKDFIKK